jgi:hypothetical protein
MGSAWSMTVLMKKCLLLQNFSAENLQGRDHLQDRNC